MRRLLVLGLLAGLGCEEDTIAKVEPALDVSPESIDFGTVELGQDAVKTVVLKNLANVPADILQISIDDDCSCFLAIDPPQVVKPYDQHDLVVRFRAVRLEQATGTLRIKSDDADLPDRQVTLVGRGSDMRRPDVEVAPAVVNFGFVPAGGIAVASFVVRSTGTNDLLVDRVRIEPADAPFRITTSTPTPERPGRLAPGGQASVALRAELPSNATATTTARIIIETNVLEEKNVPGRPGWVEIPLIAVANLAPIAVPGDDQTVEPWSRVTLDGSASYDPDVPPDNPLSFRWTLLNKPSGSTTELERARTPQPSFWADLTGTYELELVVTDALGLESEPAKVVVEALPTNAIRIELSWDHPDSDLDLHLVRQPRGEFCSCTSDVHYRDCGRTPNWYPTTPGANPRLDIDDQRGFGPENINIDGDGPARFIPDGEYDILVHYYSSNGGISSWPTEVSEATVRVYIFGLLAAELTQSMEMDGDLWVAGRLQIPELMVAPTDALIRGARCQAF